MVAYLGVSLWNSTRNTLVTSPAIKATINETSVIHGLAVRDELLISSDKLYVSASAEDGKLLARGDVIAVAMDSEAAMERESRRLELTNEIAHMELLLSGLSSPEDLTKRDTAIRSARNALSAAVSTGNTGSLSAACVELASLIFKDSTASISESDLRALKAELASIENSHYADSEYIVASSTGLFSTILDGYEHISSADLTDLTPAYIQELIAGRAAIADGTVGKLITSTRWYFAAVMDDEDAQGLTEGGYVTVSFSRRFGGDVRMRVDSISTASGGERAVLFSTLDAMAATLPMRDAEAEIVIASYTGIRVPSKALHYDEENGRSYVYVVAASQVEKKYVETVYHSGDYFLVKIESNAYALREGNEIIVSGKDLYDGKIID